MQTFIAIIFFSNQSYLGFCIVFLGGCFLLLLGFFFLVNTVSSIEVKFLLNDNMSLKILKAIMFDVSLYKHCVKI